MKQNFDEQFVIPEFTGKVRKVEVQNGKEVYERKKGKNVPVYKYHTRTKGCVNPEFKKKFKLSSKSKPHNDIFMPLKKRRGALFVGKDEPKYKGNFDVNSHFKSVSLDSWRTTEENVTTNTFATPNPLMIGPRDNHTESSFQYSEGNLHLQPNGTADDTSPTIGITTGKWYYEVHYTTIDRHAVGWTHLDNYYNNRWTPHNYGIANRHGLVGTYYVNSTERNILTKNG